MEERGYYGKFKVEFNLKFKFCFIMMYVTPTLSNCTYCDFKIWWLGFLHARGDNMITKVLFSEQAA